MIFTEFHENDIVSGRINQVSSGMFTENEDNTLKYDQSKFISGSKSIVNIDPSHEDFDPFDVQNVEYYLNVYSTKENSFGELEPNEFYFSIAYGDYDGIGSSKFNYNTLNKSENTITNTVLNNQTKVIYSQFKNMLLQPGDDLFSFASGSLTSFNSIDSKAIFAISFASDKIKDRIDPGQIQINFRNNNGSLDGDVLSLIDDSHVTNKKQNVYNLIRGRIKNGIPTVEDESVEYEALGLLYPDAGVIILNAIKLNELLNIIDVDSPVNEDDTFRDVYPNDDEYSDVPDLYSSAYRGWMVNLYNSIINVNPNVDGDASVTNHMYVRKSEFVPSTTYFVRVKNREYNYTNNPTFISDGSDGKVKGTIIHQELIDNPKTYVTTVGLYNSNNELLAVGKLSKPWVKSFDNEMLLKVRLDF